MSTTDGPNAELDTIRYAPTDGLTYNPHDPKYWDKAALDKEIVRTFDLCHGCRMCFKFCRAFPTLFEAVDQHGDVRRIPEATRQQIIDECFQCKLCYTQCPYTEAEGHEFKLDFPRLLMRASPSGSASTRSRSGIPLSRRRTALARRMSRGKSSRNSCPSATVYGHCV